MSVIIYSFLIPIFNLPRMLSYFLSEKQNIISWRIYKLIQKVAEKVILIFKLDCFSRLKQIMISSLTYYINGNKKATSPFNCNETKKKNFK